MTVSTTELPLITNYSPTRAMLYATSGCNLKNIAVKIYAIVLLPFTLLADFFLAMTNCFCSSKEIKTDPHLKMIQKATTDEPAPTSSITSSETPEETSATSIANSQTESATESEASIPPPPTQAATEEPESSDSTSSSQATESASESEASIPPPPIQAAMEEPENSDSASSSQASEGLLDDQLDNLPIATPTPIATRRAMPSRIPRLSSFRPSLVTNTTSMRRTIKKIASPNPKEFERMRMGRNIFNDADVFERVIGGKTTFYRYGPGGTTIKCLKISSPASYEEN